MKKYFDFTKTHGGIRYSYSRKPIIDEREIHSYHEILYYLDGGATLICDGFTKKLSPRTLILIPKDTYHFFKLDDPKSFERLKISFNSIDGFEELSHRELSSVRVLNELSDSTASILAALAECLKEEKDGARERAFIHGSLLLLLSSPDVYNGKTIDLDRDSLITEVLAYIESKPSGDLSTEALARALGVSSSTLSHTFKREMGISLHRYVTQKRIALADSLIAAGNIPTKIYSELGFSDYSSFYKAYVKLTGHPPSRRGE